MLGWSAGYTELQLAAARGCGQPGSVVRTGTQAADDVGARIADDVAARIFGLGGRNGSGRAFTRPYISALRGACAKQDQRARKGQGAAVAGTSGVKSGT